jgi:hypothetical protein
MQETKMFELPDRQSVFIEYGAGRSGLSTFVAKSLVDANVDPSTVKFLAIDRIPIKKKLDREIKS